MKRTITLLIALMALLTGIDTVAQRTGTNSTIPYSAATVKPTFRGGSDACNQYLHEHMFYPAAAVGTGIYGKVKLAFDVETNGAITGIRIVEGLGNKAINAAAVKLIKDMPDWVPGEKNGRRVRVRCLLSLNYTANTPVEETGSDMEFSNDRADKETVSAGAGSPAAETEKTADRPNDNEAASFTMVEQKPQFPGGESAMFKFISENLKYPAIAAENGIQGRVIVSFVVEKDGSITNIKILRSVSPELDAEARRIVGIMPRWSPGRNNGKPVRTVYNLPVSFRLS